MRCERIDFPGDNSLSDMQKEATFHLRMNMLLSGVQNSLRCLVRPAGLVCAAFFKQPFKPLQSEARLVEYTVLDVEPTSPRGAGGPDHNEKKGRKSDGGNTGKRMHAAMIEVALSADFGVNDNTHTVFSQLVGRLTQLDAKLSRWTV